MQKVSGTEPSNASNLACRAGVVESGWRSGLRDGCTAASTVAPHAGSGRRQSDPLECKKRSPEPKRAAPGEPGWRAAARGPLPEVISMPAMQARVDEAVVRLVRDLVELRPERPFVLKEVQQKHEEVLANYLQQ